MTTQPRLLALGAIRVPDPLLDDELARAASGGTLDAVGLRAALVGGDVDPPGDPAALAWFGYLLAARASRAPEGTDDGLPAAAKALALAADRGTDGVLTGVLTGELASLRAQLARLLRRPRDLDAALGDPRLPTDTAWAVAADRTHPAEGGEVEAWLAHLSEPFVATGVAPLALADGDDAPLHRLHAPAAAPGTVHGPRVSVVMPLWRPGRADLTMALRSVLAQTWADLEVLVCDDASGTDGARVIAEVLEDVARGDDRVRVLTASRNGGAYAARNLGLVEASGDFVTFADGDDWSHPQRLERQLAPLLADEDLVCSLSWALRARPDLGVVQLGRGAVRVNMSSSTYRRSVLLERLGGFDAVRRGADAELLDRTAAACGPAAVRDDREVLAVVQLTTGSLSRDDFGMSWTHPDRADYKRSSWAWHAAIRSGAPARVTPGDRAPFPAAAHVRGEAAVPAVADVGLLADLDPRTRAAVDVGAEVDVLADHLAAAAALPLVAVDAPTRADLRPKSLAPLTALERRAARGEVLKLGYRQPARLRRLVVRDPAALAPLRAGVLDVRADEALVVVDSPDPTAADLVGVEALLAPVARRVRWLPTTPEAAAALRSAGARAPVDEPRPWSAASLAERDPAAAVRPDGVAYAPLVDDLERRDARALARRWAPAAGRARSDTRTARLLGLDPEAADLRDVWDSTADVLAGLDVVVVVAPVPAARGADVRVLRCLAAGCVVLADPVTAARFGGVVVPVEPGATDTALDAVRDDVTLRTRLRRAGIDLARRRTGPQVLAATLAEVLVPGSRPDPG